jgi:hypothetical protein
MSASLLSWNLTDQQRLDALLEQRRAFFEEKTGPVRELVENAFWLPKGSSKAHDIVEWAIENADALRDVLAPFDSGVRPG